MGVQKEVAESNFCNWIDRQIVQRHRKIRDRWQFLGFDAISSRRENMWNEWLKENNEREVVIIQKLDNARLRVGFVNGSGQASSV